jgi:branched-chain amino acid transport system permease protein
MASSNTTTAGGHALRRGLFPFTRAPWLAASLIVLLAVLPVIGGKIGLISNYSFLQLNLMMMFAIAVLGVNLVTGFNGQISLGHGAFMCVGAYVTAILMARFGWPYWATFPAVAVVCFVVGYLFGLPALRLEGHYLALATFSLAVAVPQMVKYRHIEELTGGVQGIELRRVRAPFDLALTADQWLYLVTLAAAVLMFWIARNLLNSRTGRALMAIRDQPIAAATMGINLAQYKAVTFGISALITGEAGALYALVSEGVAPDSFTVDLSITLLVGMVVGGIASLPGAVLGGVFVQVIDKYADAITRELTGTLHLPIEIEPWTIYGIVLIALVYLMPTGIAGAFSRLAARGRLAWRLRVGQRKSSYQRAEQEKETSHA